MSLFFWFTAFLVSLFLLVFFARAFTKTAKTVGTRFGMSPFLIGATIVGAGTSLPELASSIAAVWQGKTELVAANVIGSNIGNILFILGVVSIISFFTGSTITLERRTTNLEILFLCGSTVVFSLVLFNGSISRLEGMGLIAAFSLYLGLKIFGGTKKELVFRRTVGGANASEDIYRGLTIKELLTILLEVVLLWTSAHFTVETMMRLSIFLEIPATFIAITALAIGTSLPELFVSIYAALTKENDLSLGNIMGSNIFNIFVVGGLPAILVPLEVDTLTFKVGVPFLILSTLLLLNNWWQQKIGCISGMFYVLCFSIFLATLWWLR